MPFATNEGVKIFWREQGAGEPVVLIMGLGVTSDSWRLLVPRLTPFYRVILLDNRGTGQSDIPPGPYSIPVMADDVAAVMDAAGMASAHVHGLSMGGLIAQELALRAPARVRSLILSCTSCGARDAIPAEREAVVALAVDPSLTREEALRRRVPFTYDPATPSERVEEDLARRLATPYFPDGYAAQLQGIRNWEGSFSRLGTLTVPTLVIHGEHDRLVPPANGELLARSIPGARLAMIREASHILLTDQLDAFSQAVMAFLAEVSAPVRR